MTSQFKTFIKFIILGGFILLAGFVVDKFGGDGGLILVAGIVLFLGMIWYEISYSYSKNNPGAVFSSHRELISSLVISSAIFLLFFEGFFYVENLGLSLEKYLYYPTASPLELFAYFRLIPEAILLLAIVLWIWAITHSIQVRADNTKRKSAEKKIILLATIIGILIYFLLTHAFSFIGFLVPPNF